MPQQNLLAETLFTIIAAQARCMLIAGQILDDEQFKLWPEAVNSLSAKSVLAGEKLVATYSIST
jgi:hypothetical protein